MPSPSIPLTLQSLIDSGDYRLARLWKVTRTDGQVVSVTDHNRNIVYAGVEYESVGAFEASAEDLPDGLTPLDQNATSYISPEKVTEEDLILGKYEGAKIDYFVISWPHPWAGFFVYRKYEVERVTVQNETFVLHLSDLGSKLNTLYGQIYTKECGNELGDAFGLSVAGCKQDVSLMEVTGTISSVTLDRFEFDTGITTVKDRTGANTGNSTDWFAFGKVEFTGGLNAGAILDIQESTSTGGITLLGESPYSMSVGDAFTLTPGCSRLFEVCKSKFFQKDNYDGFPHVPGTDKLYVTP